MRAIEDKNRFDWCCEESNETVEQGSDGGVGATYDTQLGRLHGDKLSGILTTSSLSLELPNRNVNGETKWSARAVEAIRSQLGQRHPLARSQLTVYPVKISTKGSLLADTAGVFVIPFDPHRDLTGLQKRVTTRWALKQADCRFTLDA